MVMTGGWCKRHCFTYILYRFGWFLMAGDRPFLMVLTLKLSFHPSTSLVVRTTDEKTLHNEGGQVVLYIQAVDRYCMKNCNGAVAAWTHSRTNMG